MNENLDSKLKQSPTSKRISYFVCIVNFVLVLFLLLAFLPLPQYHVRAGTFDYVFFIILLIWLVCAFLSFFWSKFVWFGCLPVGMMVWKSNPSALTIFIIFLTLCLMIFVGILKYRRKCALRHEKKR